MKRQHRIWRVELFSEMGLERLDKLIADQPGDVVIYRTDAIDGEFGHKHVLVKRAYEYHLAKPSDADEFAQRILKAVGRSRCLISGVDRWVEDVK